jgi:hypothetical protein
MSEVGNEISQHSAYSATFIFVHFWWSFLFVLIKCIFVEDRFHDKLKYILFGLQFL